MAKTTVRMTRYFPGMIEEVPLPHPPGRVTLPVDRAAQLVALGVAEPLEDSSTEHAAMEPRETATAERRGPGRPRSK